MLTIVNGPLGPQFRAFKNTPCTKAAILDFSRKRLFAMGEFAVFFCHNDAISGNGGLVIFYVDNTYTSKVKLNINMHESWERLIVQITGGGLIKTVTLGNMYRPPVNSILI